MMTVRKVFTGIVAAALLGLAAAQLSSCEKFVLPEVGLSKDTLLFSAAAGSQSLQVTTNVITTIKVDLMDEMWLVADPAWIDESSTVTFTVEANTGTEARTATVPVKSESILKNVVVIQEGKH